MMRGSRFIRISGVKVDVLGDVPEKRGRLTPLGRKFVAGGNPMVVCQCDCGVVLVVYSGNIVAGNTTSCGCWRAEILSARHASNELRDMRAAPEYSSWFNMKSRCANPGTENYANYGGRGIAVCERWVNSFENFYSDMGPKPSQQHSLDRFPNNNGNYEPGNCRWATRQEQDRNKRNNVLLTIGGRSLTVAEWSRISLIPYGTIYHRLKSGWTHERAVFSPPNKKH